MYNINKKFGFLLVFWIQIVSSDINVDLTSDGPVVLGATIHFNAHLSMSDGSVPTGEFRYRWADNSLQQNSAEMILKSASSSWNITYGAHVYPPGPYVVEVEVAEREFGLWWNTITSQRLRYRVTALLNGELILTQGTQVQNGRYIASNLPVRNEVVLNAPDFKYINDSATNITTMWFLDCKHIFTGPGFNFSNNYPTPEEAHMISGLIIADFNPPPTPPPPTTTTPKPTTTTPTTTTTTATTTSTKRTRRDISSVESPFKCKNITLIELEPNKTYGYFQRHFTIKAPIQNVSITGNNWIQRGDILNLNVNCKGSEPIRYCLSFENGLHNATGNETCPDPPSPLETCNFNITHLFRDEKEHTIYIILVNDVTKIVKTAGVQFYQSIKHPQLSVIVVPVVFSLIAVVLIVFGAAYWVQNRTRFIVEVADFDFGQQYAEMEYKTFYERLRESILATFVGNWITRDDDFPEEEPGVTTATSNGFKYGSM